MSGFVNIIRCHVGTQIYCIDQESTQGVHPAEKMIPGRNPDGSIGFLELGEERLPVFRLTDQLEGIPMPPARGGVIVVARHGDRKWGLLVDKAGGAQRVPSSRVFPLPSVVGDSQGGQFQGVVIDDLGLSLHLAPERIVPASVSGAFGKARQQAPEAGRSRMRESILSRVELQSGAGNVAEHPRSQGRKIVSFTLKHAEEQPVPIRFAIGVLQTMEVVTAPPLIAVPKAPAFVIGLTSWRALPVPVVDLAAWFGLPPARHRPGGRLLICRGLQARNTTEESLLAVAAIGEIRKHDLPVSCRPWQEASALDPALVLGVYRYERGMLIVPHLDAILDFRAPTCCLAA